LAKQEAARSGGDPVVLTFDLERLPPMRAESFGLEAKTKDRVPVPLNALTPASKQEVRALAGIGLDNAEAFPELDHEWWPARLGVPASLPHTAEAPARGTKLRSWALIAALAASVAFGRLSGMLHAQPVFEAPAPAAEATALIEPLNLDALELSGLGRPIELDGRRIVVTRSVERTPPLFVKTEVFTLSDPKNPRSVVRLPVAEGRWPAKIAGLDLEVEFQGRMALIRLYQPAVRQPTIKEETLPRRALRAGLWPVGVVSVAELKANGRVEVGVAGRQYVISYVNLRSVGVRMPPQLLVRERSRRGWQFGEARRVLVSHLERGEVVQRTLNGQTLELRRPPAHPGRLARRAGIAGGPDGDGAAPCASRVSARHRFPR
jgi:hypothetical protein